jgi:hypothetical protein
VFDFIINTSLKQRLIVLGVSLLLIIYGALTVRKMPVDVFPDLNKPMVTLMTEAGGMAPEEVEQLITFPVEAAMNGMPGVTRVRSVSGHRPVGGVCRVRVGKRDLPQSPADRGTSQPGPRAVAAGHRSADGADLVDHGRDPAHRLASRPRQGQPDAGPGIRGLGDSPAPADHSRASRRSLPSVARSSSTALNPIRPACRRWQ